MKVMLKVQEIFSSQKVNTGRQLELDIARGLAVFFMILVHVQMTFAQENLEDSVFGCIIDFLGGIPAAPVFMFLMGIGFLYSRQQSPAYFFKRGIIIFSSAYLLNFLRESSPELLDFLLEGTKESITTAIESFITVDILQFAGLAMLFFALVNRLKISNKYLAGLGILLPVCAYLLRAVEYNQLFAVSVSGLFWGSNDLAEFPFMVWIFYPIAGYLFANFLMKCKQKKQFYLLNFAGATFLFLLMVGLAFLLDIDLGFADEVEYYHHHLYASFVFLFFILFWLSILYFSCKMIPEKIVIHIKRWSKNVTAIYFIHWIMIGWLGYFFYEKEWGILYLSVAAILIMTLSDGIAYVYSRVKK
jgi:uncharacterized membrane protein